VDGARAPDDRHELLHRRGRQGSAAGAASDYAHAVVDWETVRELALSFPEAEESAEGRLAFRVRGKLFAWEARERDGGGLGVRVDRDEKDLLLDARPDAYFSSPHYTGYPALQVRLEEIDRDELLERLEDAWLIQAPKRLAAAYVASADAQA
jgi:hypothetical protein